LGDERGHHGQLAGREEQEEGGQVRQERQKAQPAEPSRQPSPQEQTQHESVQGIAEDGGHEERREPRRWRGGRKAEDDDGLDR
jgi:hypothetical protein